MNHEWPVWADNPDFPRATTQDGNWNGARRTFEIVFHFDRVYFRLSDEPQRVWATLESCAPDEWESCFSQALKSGDFGFYFVASNFPTFRAPIGRGPNFTLRAICHRSGVGWIREWSSPDWLWFNPRATRVLTFAPDYLFPHDGRTIPDWFFPAIKQKRDELLFRAVGDAEWNGLGARWVSGSKEEFFRVAPLLWRAGLIEDDAQSSYLKDARRVSLNSYGWSFVWGAFVGQPEFLQWLQSRIHLTGYDWRPSVYWTRKYRLYFSLVPRARVRFQLQRALQTYSLANASAPSFHEKLEGALELRACLEELSTNENIDAATLERWCSSMKE